MTDERNKTPENNTPGQIPSSESPTPKSFGKLSKRITGITSNCLFTAIVLVAGLGIGRQILIWWSVDETKQAVPAGGSAIGFDPAGLHVLQFGSKNWSMARREFRGPRDALDWQLKADCRTEIEKASMPQDDQTPEQKELLAFLAKSAPVDSEPARWQIFALDRKLPILIGVIPPPSNAEKQPVIDPGSSRVVLWGIALPKGNDEWTILIFLPSNEGAGESQEPFDVPLPAECHKILAVQSVGGGMTTFSGPNEPKKWQVYFGGWFDSHDWRLISPWQKIGSSWYTQYRGKSRGKTVEIDLHFSPDNKNGMTGTMIFRVRE
jgi:hypothetical protein